MKSNKNKNSIETSKIELKRCTKCIMPETQQGIVFDEKGVCGTCRQIEIKTKIDWKAREKDLVKLIEQYRGKYSYDCIIPFSGGKDSTFTTYTLVRKYGLKPLLVSFDHGFFRPRTLENRVRTVKKLGVDILTFRTNWRIVKKLMLESLKSKGDFCWHCHTGVFAYPMQIAVKFNIPLVFWGEPSAEYTSYYSYNQPEEVDEQKFNKLVNLGITADDMLKFLNGSVDARDLEPFRYPSLENLRAINYRSVYLGSYIPWDTKKQAEIIKKELDWQWDVVEGIPESYGYQKIECMLYGMRDYLLFIKKGFGRTAHLVSIDIRNNRLFREEGLKLAKKYDGKRPASMDWFLDILGITEKEFMDIAFQHVTPPHIFDHCKVKRGEKLWDQDLWDTTK
jgi:N-acetyl sugar amidotransferase